jgi:hypothetical protein
VALVLAQRAAPHLGVTAEDSPHVLAGGGDGALWDKVNPAAQAKRRLVRYCQTPLARLGYIQNFHRLCSITFSAGGACGLATVAGAGPCIPQRGERVAGVGRFTKRQIARQERVAEASARVWRSGKPPPQSALVAHPASTTMRRHRSAAFGLQECATGWRVRLVQG